METVPKVELANDTHRPKVDQPLVGMPVPKVVHELPQSSNTKMKHIAFGIVVILAGVGTGWFLAGGPSAESGTPTPTANIAEGTTAGSVDESVLSDNATGVLHEGGIEGEGTHYLDTGAGAEKYVYLLSTVIDLQSFVGKKIQVWGQTLAAENAGWLMDVGKVKVVE